MGKRDPRVDAYVAKSAPFAKPILEYFRETVHAACPEVEETMKWSMPHFDYKGVLCSMASFKQHCAFGFWKASLLFPEAPPAKEAMGHLGRVTSIEDLPPKRELVALVKKAAKLNDEGVKVEKVRTPRAAVDTPGDLSDALEKNSAARKVFENFSPSARREYIDWITDAKSSATRQKRLDQSIEWIAEGKPRNWKYMKKG